MVDRPTLCWNACVFCRSTENVVAPGDVPVALCKDCVRARRSDAFDVWVDDENTSPIDAFPDWDKHAEAYDAAL